MGFLVVVVLQAMFAAHAVQRGHGWNWVFLILFCPILGFMIYAYLVAIPEMQHSNTSEAAEGGGKPPHDPERELRYHTQQLEIADTIANRTRLAEVLVRNNQPEAAIPLYEKSLQGLYTNDAQLLSGLAQAAFAAKDFEKARETLSQIISSRPHDRLQEQHLLYARTLEALNEFETARQAYQDLAAVYPGPEAKFYYAKLLKQHGEVDMAKRMMQEIDTTAKQSSDYYNAYHRECIGMAREELR